MSNVGMFLESWDGFESPQNRLFYYKNILTSQHLNTLESILKKKNREKINFFVYNGYRASKLRSWDETAYFSSAVKRSHF